MKVILQADMSHILKTGCWWCKKYKSILRSAWLPPGFTPMTTFLIYIGFDIQLSEDRASPFLHSMWLSINFLYTPSVHPMKNLVSVDSQWRASISRVNRLQQDSIPTSVNHFNREIILSLLSIETMCHTEETNLKHQLIYWALVVGLATVPVHGIMPAFWLNK